MRKVYICPETEVVKSHLAQDCMQKQSFDWADAKGNDEFFDEDEETIKSRNLWDE